MDHFPGAWGRPRDDVYGPYDGSYLQTSGPIQHTQQPQITGTSVVALKYSDGVVIAADNLASFGSMARFRSIHRLISYSPTTLLGFGGDVSDMQYVSRLLSSLATEEGYDNSAHALCASNLHKYLSKVYYNRRTKMNPLWNAVLVAGFEDTAGAGGDGAVPQPTVTPPKDEFTSTTTLTAPSPVSPNAKPFLASVDLLGTTFSAPSIATGFGAHLAIPQLRRLAPDEEAASKLTREQAEKAVRECMKILFYRDARSLSEFDLAIITRQGTEMLKGEKLEAQSWAFAEKVTGYGTQTV